MIDRPDGAVLQIRSVFRQLLKPLTLKEIKDQTQLKSSEISMGLCYLLKRRYVKRELIDNTAEKKRKKVYQYFYTEERYAEVKE